ncbi:Gfo/Idh/MocA family oxidoreductase [bacterium]|nr:Gfo/Idh/MocA family oxidoreductase [bacterium]
MAERKICFGILGAGLIAPFHAKGILAANGILAGFADRLEDRAAKLAAEFNCKSWGSLEAMLEDPQIDVVNITTPNHVHAPVAIAAAKAGKHVLCEKPPAMKLADVDAMMAAANETGVKLAIVLNCRTKAPIVAMRKALDEGRFGKIYQVDAIMKWWRTTEYYLGDAWRQRKDSGAGATIQQGFHYIDLMQYLGGRIVSVDSRMGNLAHQQVAIDDTVRSFVEFENGAVGSFIGSTALWPGQDIRIEISGENGTAVMIGERMAVWKFRDERPEDEAIRQLGIDSGPTGATGQADFGFVSHQMIIEDFTRAILAGGDPVAPAPSARHTLEVCLAMYKSAKEGGPIKLPLMDDSGIF